jgi:hypothetical protein
MHTTITASETHDIDPLLVKLAGGPDEGDETRISKIAILDGMRVVVGRAGEGFYWLPRSNDRDHVTGRLLAIWEPHSDARVSWTREI